MSSSGSVFSSTLQSITNAKLNELSKKRRLFEDQKASLLASVEREPVQIKRLNILLDGVSQIFAAKSAKRKRGVEEGEYEIIIPSATCDSHLETLLETIGHFLKQATYDPSISPKLLQSWEQSLARQLQVQSQKYQYASLYGQLAMEWLSSDSPTPTGPDDPETLADAEEIHEDEAQARQEARSGWEKLVFEPLVTDTANIIDYLDNLFGNGGANKQAVNALKALRTSIDGFDPGQFDEFSLRWTIKGLLSSDLLSAEKRAALKDFLASSVILGEICDVLNLRLASIAAWTWDIDGLPVELRRDVTGKYHVYIEEDLLQAIFLQFIGVKWSVFFKQAFTTFSNFSGAWKSLRKVPVDDKKRREYFLGMQTMKPSVQSKRQGIYKSIYFMSELHDSENKESSSLDGEVEVNYESYNDIQQPQAKLKRRAAPVQAMPMMMQAPPRPTTRAVQPPSTSAHFGAQSMGIMRRSTDGTASSEYDLLYDHEKPNSPMATKQFLLHLVSTELIVNTQLHGEFTCARSEFESWNSSLPHSTINSVLSFFGLSEKWREFFRRFLECPLRFVDDDPMAQPRIRKRGVPGAHVLSTVIGETILFCLDYAVNQNTDGAQLHRMYDDFWIWSSSHQSVIKAWEAITRFTDVMGVTLNKGKTGTVRIVRDKNEPGDIDPSLPSGDIRWGFLRLDPVSARFIIDQDMVNIHIDKLERQLQGRKSIFDWIQTWNAFAGRFFTSNFGKPANCFGREHVASMLVSLETIQRRIFSGTNVVQYLKTLIEERFGVSDIPDGYLYFPTSLGGLELHNPFIDLVQLRDAVLQNPTSALENIPASEAEEYRQAKFNYEHGTIYRDNNIFPQFVPADRATFMSLEEFTRYREEFYSMQSGNIYSVFENLLKQPEKMGATPSSHDSQLFQEHNIHGEYWQWLALMYKDDMIERFGGLNIVDRTLLPSSIISVYQSGRVKWQG